MVVVLPPVDCVRLSVSLDRKLLSNLSGESSELYLMNQLLNQCFGVLSVDYSKPPINQSPSGPLDVSFATSDSSSTETTTSTEHLKKTIVLKRRSFLSSKRFPCPSLASSKKRRALYQLATSSKTPKLKRVERNVAASEQNRLEMRALENSNHGMGHIPPSSHFDSMHAKRDSNPEINQCQSLSAPIASATCTHDNDQIKFEPDCAGLPFRESNHLLIYADNSNSDSTSSNMGNIDIAAVTDFSSTTPAVQLSSVTSLRPSQGANTGFDRHVMIADMPFSCFQTHFPSVETQKQKFKQFSKSSACRLHEIVPIGCFEDFVKFNQMIQDQDNYPNVGADLRNYMRTLSKEEFVRSFLNCVMHPMLQDEFSFTGKKQGSEEAGKRPFRETPFYAFMELEALKSRSFEVADIPEFQRKIKNHLTHIYRKAKKIDKNYQPFAVRIASAALLAKRKAAYSKRKFNRQMVADFWSTYRTLGGESSNVNGMLQDYEVAIMESPGEDVRELRYLNESSDENNVLNVNTGKMDPDSDVGDSRHMDLRMSIS